MNVSYSRYQDPPSSGTLDQNIQRFSGNVVQLETKVRQLQAGKEDAALKRDIIQLLTTCAQLAKSVDASLKERKEHQDMSKDLQYKRLVAGFQQSLTKFKSLQEATSGIEQSQLKLARAESVRRSKHNSEARENTQLLSPDAVDQQAQAFAGNDLDLQERQHVISQLEHDIMDMNEIFRDLATMVQDQGETIGQIEVNVEAAATRVEVGNIELGKAVSYKNRNRKLKICIAVIIISVIITIVIVILIILGATGAFSKK